MSLCYCPSEVANRPCAVLPTSEVCRNPSSIVYDSQELILTASSGIAEQICRSVGGIPYINPTVNPSVQQSVMSAAYPTTTVVASIDDVPPCAVCFMPSLLTGHVGR